jgi:hypothetical protein
VVPEYAVDTGLLAEMRETENDVAREVGQLIEKQEIDLRAAVQSATVTLATVFTHNSQDLCTCQSKRARRG